MTDIGRSAGDGTDLADEVGQPVDADTRERRSDEHGELEAVEHLVGERALQLGRASARRPTGTARAGRRRPRRSPRPIRRASGALRRRCRRAGERCDVDRPGRIRRPGPTGRRRFRAATPPRRAAVRVATKPWPHLACSAASTLWKLARGLSSLLTNTSRGMLAGDATLPRQFGADLDAVDGTHHEDGEVGDTESPPVSSPTKSV